MMEKDSLPKLSDRMIEFGSRIEALLVNPTKTRRRKVFDLVFLLERDLDAAIARAEAAEAERDSLTADRDFWKAAHADNELYALGRFREDETEQAALRARIAELEAALDDAQLLADERGENIAELEAGQGWRPVTEKPSQGQQVKVHAILNAVYWADDDVYDVYQMPDEMTIEEWRPAPQE